MRKKAPFFHQKGTGQGKTKTLKKNPFDARPCKEDSRRNKVMGGFHLRFIKDIVKYAHRTTQNKQSEFVNVMKGCEDNSTDNKNKKRKGSRGSRTSMDDTRNIEGNQ